MCGTETAITIFIHPVCLKRSPIYTLLSSSVGSLRLIDRGTDKLHWVLPRSLSSDGVVVEDCEPNQNPHCSKLTLRHLQAGDTGTYTCSYSQKALRHVYVYVKGETRVAMPSKGAAETLG